MGKYFAGKISENEIDFNKVKYIYFIHGKYSKSESNSRHRRKLLLKSGYLYIKKLI